MRSKAGEEQTVRAQSSKPPLRTLVGGIEKVLRPLFAPALIAMVLAVFLALTYLLARLLIYLADLRSLAILLLAWLATTLAGIALLRQLPRMLHVPGATGVQSATDLPPSAARASRP